jgi:two-component system, response regulator YesN
MLKLFVVDDEKLTREGIKESFDWEKIGVEIVGDAEDGIQALSRIEELNPDIIICDVRMPKMDGIELTRVIRSKYPQMQIIFLSGYSDKEYLKSAIKINAVDYIEKPVDDEELKEAVLRAAAKCRELKKPDSDINDFSCELDSLLDEVYKKDIGKTVKEIIKFIKVNFDQDLSLINISEHFYLTPTYLCKIFKKETGLTIVQFITLIRVEKSRDFLKDRKLKLYNVASKVGYSDQNYYAKIFKKYMGCNPYDYKEKYMK